MSKYIVTDYPIGPDMAERLMEYQFKELGKTWLHRAVYWVIDSKYRKQEEIKDVVRRQLYPYIPSNSVLMKEANKIPNYSNNEDQLNAIVEHVQKNYSYKTDMDNFGYVERWEDLEVAIPRRVADCETQALLVYCLARIKGVPSSLLYLFICDAWVPWLKQYVGHCALAYWDMSTDKLRVVDTTYFQNDLPVQQRNVLRESRDDYKTVSYLFNENVSLRGYY